MAVQSWSPTALTHGSPGQQNMARMRRDQALKELIELEEREAQHEDVKRQGGPFSSGYANEREYRDGLNRKGRIADLRSRVSGSGPARVQSFAGSHDYERQTMPQQRPALRALVDEPGDNMDYYMRQAQLRGANAQADRAEMAGFDEWDERNPMMVKHRGDVRRGEETADYEMDAENARNRFYDDAPVRRQQLWDDEERGQRLGPYSPHAIKGQTELEKQREISARESMKALTGYAGRVDAQAIRSTGALGAAEANQGRDVTGYRDEIAGQMPGAAKEVTQQEIADLAREHGASPQDVIAYFQQRGYRIR